MAVTAVRVEIRPERLRRICLAIAAIVLAGFTAAAIMLPGSTDLGVSDQVGLGGVGLFAAAGVMVFARPRLYADADGLRVRNIFGSHEVPWQLVSAVRFDDRSYWASLEFPNGDVLSLLAVQALDGERAVTAIRGLRMLQEQYGAGR